MPSMPNMGNMADMANNPQVQEMMKNPDMIKNMMKSMNPDMIKNMGKMMGDNNPMASYLEKSSPVIFFWGGYLFVYFLGQFFGYLLFELFVYRKIYKK